MADSIEKAEGSDIRGFSAVTDSEITSIMVQMVIVMDFTEDEKTYRWLDSWRKGLSRIRGAGESKFREEERAESPA